MIVEREIINRYKVLGERMCESTCFYIKTTKRCFQIHKNSEMIVAIIPGVNGGGRRLVGVKM